MSSGSSYFVRQRGYRKYKETCEGFVALRPVPTAETVSMIDAVRGDLPRSERIIAEFPSGEQMCAWMTEAHGSAPPQRGEVVLFPHQGGIFPLHTGLVYGPDTSNDPSDDDNAQRAARAYMDECQGFLVVCKNGVEGDIEMRIAVSKPDTDQMIAWAIEHYNAAPPKPNEIKLVEHEGGLYPFEAGAFIAAVRKGW